jgi:hypothetical protein
MFSDESIKDFENKTVLVEEIDDPCFGPLRIFRRLNPV